MCPSPVEIPAPTDPAAIEHDAPPPGDRGFLQPSNPALYPRRPSSRIVDLASEKPRVIVRG